MMCLVRRLAKLEDYYADLRSDKSLFQRIQAFDAKIRFEFQEGDQIWEWESRGFREFSGVTGILIERNGDIVKVWTTGRS